MFQCYSVLSGWRVTRTATTQRTLDRQSKGRRFEFWAKSIFGNAYFLQPLVLTTVCGWWPFSQIVRY